MVLTKSQAKVPSEHFDFNEWQQAFDHYYEMIATHGPDAVQFVCSEHPHTSGYWVEPAGCECSVGDTVVCRERVDELKQKIKDEIESASNEGRSPKFVRL